MPDRRPIETVTQRVENQRPISSMCCFCIPMKFACFCLGYLTLIFNVFNTLVIVGAMIVTGFLSQGITLIMQTTGNGTDEFDPEIEMMNKYLIAYLLIVTGVILLLNIIWMCWNVYMLVGLHERRPGPIMLHMSIGSIRFTLMILILVTSLAPSNTTFFILSTSFEICATGLFVIVYHSFATQLKRNQQPSIDVETSSPQISVNDAHFAYPKKLDKQHLVASEKY